MTPIRPNAFAAARLRKLHASLNAFDTSGFSAVASEWSRFDATRDARVRVLNGEQVLEGIARGVDTNGALLVDAADGRHRLHAGEIGRGACRERVRQSV